MLTHRKNLAKISATPGKTQLINHFTINQNPNKKDLGWYLADLPGYGYAKVSKKKRGQFKGAIFNYLENRPNLISVFALIDLRIPPQKIDLEFMEWMGMRGIPFVITFTKIDKLSSSAVLKQRKEFQKAMSNSWEELPPVILTSSKSAHGKDELLAYIEEHNPIFDQV